jgi:hypothetical protein
MTLLIEQSMQHYNTKSSHSVLDYHPSSGNHRVDGPKAGHVFKFKLDHSNGGWLRDIQNFHQLKDKITKVGIF